MHRIEFIPASLGSRPTSFRGPKIRARQLRDTRVDSRNPAHLIVAKNEMAVRHLVVN